MPPEMGEPVRTTCPYCGVGCGIVATRTGERTVAIEGDPDHPANRGRLCSKGTHLGETVSLEGRLLTPMIGDRTASWDKALDLVAKRFRDTIARHGPNSVAFYVSGQLLTEDYYVANKLRTSTPTRGCACRARSPGISARSARISCRRATTISTPPT
jgi:assimilatory nitrate reductase catalytic subunit